MRIIGISLIMFCAVICVNAQKATKVNPAVVKAKIKQLKVQQKKYAKSMHTLRVKLIKTDPELKKMHESIMAMHRELALKMAAKSKKMQSMVMQYDKAGKQISNLQKSLKRK